jgi:glycosyltransferase involved in cell wall biosynthesis
MISVILPTRNASEVELNRAIESCLSLNVHVCIWFDHDGNEPISTTYINHPLVTMGVGRVGKVQAMNNALVMVKTPYYLYLGDDDYIGAGIVELAVMLESSPEYDFAYGLQQFIGARNDAVVARQYSSDDLFYSNVPMNAILYRTEIARAIGYDDNIHNIEGAGKPEDYDLTLTLHEQGHRGIAVNTQDVVIYYTLSHEREWAKMTAHNNAVVEAFKRKHPSFRSTYL